MNRASIYDLVIRGGTLVDSREQKREDIAVRGGKIVARGDCPGDATEVVDATGLHVFPGGIDAHVHLNEPGRTEWEGFATGTAALAAGGCTTFFDMPLNSSPLVLDAATFQAKAEAFARNSCLDGAFWGGLTPGNLGQLAGLAACGVIGFKAFMSNSGLEEFPCSDAKTLREGMARAADLRLPVAVHAESEEMTSRLTREKLAAGHVEVRDYLDSRPIAAEVEAIGQALEIAQSTGGALHIVHVSSAEGLRLIAAAKARGIDVTAETCAHYLLLDERELHHMGGIAKCAPPLRSIMQQKELWSELVEGHVDTLGSDHSPSPPEMKVGENIFEVWGGIAGCQFAWPLLCEAMQLDLPLFVRMASANVARRFRLPDKGDLEIGFDADLSLVSFSEPHEITADELLTRHKISPYVGRSTSARVKATFLRGERVYGAQKKNKLGSARILRPNLP